MLAAGDRARELRENPAWITGIEHRIETPVLGARDLTTSPSTAASAAAATGGDVGSIDVAELYAPFTHQQLILTEAIGLSGSTKVNPSGGALAANPMFSTGLERIGFAARHIFDGSAQRVLAHATSGAALQQNLVAVHGRDSDERSREEQKVSTDGRQCSPRSSAPGRPSTSPSARTSR